MPDDDKTKTKRLPLHESLAARIRQGADDGAPIAVTTLILAVAEAQLKPEHRKIVLRAAQYASKMHDIDVNVAFKHLAKQYKDQDTEEAAAKIAAETSADKTAEPESTTPDSTSPAEKALGKTEDGSWGRNVGR